MSKRRKNYHVDKKKIKNENRNNINARYRIDRVFRDYIYFKHGKDSFDSVNHVEKQKIKKNFVKDYKKKLERMVILNDKREKSHQVYRPNYEADRLVEDLKEVTRLKECLRRKERRSSLFAFKSIGKGRGSHVPHKWTEKSYEVRC